MKPVASIPSDAAEQATSTLDRALITAFLENVPDIIYFKDRECRFIAVSRSKARRHDAEPIDLMGKSDADFFSKQHAERARLDEETIMATGTPVLNRLERTQFIDGREGWTEVTKLPLCDKDASVIGTFGLSRDVTEAHRIKLELEKAQRKLVQASRMAGMAEVATGVLHNVGNVLTSLNVSANMIGGSLRQSKTSSLDRLSALLQEHESDLGAFLTDDPKGRRIPEYIDSLAQHWIDERDRMLKEIASLQENVDHIKEIVTMQQSYATMIGVLEALDPKNLMEDAVRMNAGALARHDVSCVRDFHPTPHVVVEKAKVLQILINLIRNAKYATDEARSTNKLITLKVRAGGPGRVQLLVQDNGIGIAPENLSKLFTHGFTTRSEGHGFGLHSSLVVAKEMKGDLTVQSDGIGKGATFILDLPAATVAGN